MSVMERKVQFPVSVDSEDCITFIGRKFRMRNPVDDLRELVPDARVIVDAGADVGRWTKKARAAWPDAIIHAYEPRRESFLQLQQCVDSERFRPHMAALADSAGERTMNVTVSPESSSILAPLPLESMSAWHAVDRSETVRCVALDECRIQADVIKLDLQGYELVALRGAVETLSHARAVFTEVSFTAMYDGQPLLEDMDSFMSGHGFVRKYLYCSPFPDMYGDALYLRRDGDSVATTTIERGDTSVLRLNIGAGENPIEGYTNLDLKTGTDGRSLPNEDNSADEIRASHVLEHFDYKDVEKALREWHRVLKPGGILRLSVPDVRKIDFNNPQWRFFLMGGQTDSDDYHKSAFDEHYLRAMLANCGYADIEYWESDQRDTSKLPVSLNLVCKKSATATLEIKIAAVVSIPRLGWNDHWGCIVEALKPFKIPVRRFTGAFWDQGIQAALESCVQDNLDWALTLDYDTMFTAQHLDAMFGHFGRHPEIDALAPIQCKRNCNQALVSRKGVEHQEITPEPFQADTAHFGCTLIRVESLKKMPQPWFLGVPNDDGSWKHNGCKSRLDPDIYFWKKWKQFGNTLYIAPDVVVGHLEVLVSEFNQNYEHVYTPVYDWIQRERV